jgi:hypothetical protein
MIHLLAYTFLALPVFLLAKYLIKKIDGWSCIGDLRKTATPTREMTSDEVELVESLLHPIVQSNEERARSIRPLNKHVYVIKGEIKASQIFTSESFSQCMLGKYPVNIHRSLQTSVLEENLAEVALSRRSAIVLTLNNKEIGNFVEHVNTDSPAEENICSTTPDHLNQIRLWCYFSALSLILSIHQLVSSTLEIEILPGSGAFLLLGVMIALLFIALLGSRDREVYVTLSEDGIQYVDDSSRYRRNDFIPFSEIASIKMRNRLLFKTLTIDIKDSNQRYFLFNAITHNDFLRRARQKINQS